jgi:alpha/beta superfamily hydrolase
MEDSEGLLEEQKFENNFPIIVFCSANAGIAEYMQYSSEYLDYYTQLGINVVLWNYRGFGNSEGNPDP